MPIIEIINGVTRHPDKRMAEPVNLRIEQGEQVAIVGDNASGKSRLVDIITGRYPLLRMVDSNGVVTAPGEVLYDFGDSPHRLVSDNMRRITFRDSYGDSDGTYYLQQRWNQHDIDPSTPMVDGKYIISLSSGELRKYVLRRALANAPRLLIIESPYIGLDAQARQQLTDMLTELTQQGLQVILVLPTGEEIPPYVTHIIPLENLKVGAKKIVYPATKLNTSPTKSITSPTKIITSAGKQSILRMCDVTVRYFDKVILSHFNWTVGKGERWALRGANGSGKSTLLSLICADNPQAYACDIELFGRRRGTGESIWDIKRHIGYVSPEMHRAYMRDLPSIDIVASGLVDTVGLYVRPRPEQRAQCVEWMQRFGIDHLADRTFLSLSSGEQRLVLVCRAFVKNPDLLILDEPLHGLDARNKQLVRRIITEYTSSPDVTLIMVSHYDEELPDNITNVITLKPIS